MRKDGEEWVLVEIEGEGVKLDSIFEKEFAEHLVKQRKYVVRIVRKATEEELNKRRELDNWFVNEMDRYYTGTPTPSKKREWVLIEIGDDVKIDCVVERDFAEYLMKQGKYPVKIVRGATEKELNKRAEIDAWIYHEAMYYYD